MNLLILDISGLLCCKVPKEFVVDDSLEFIDLEHYKVIFRPNIKVFLNKCYEKYSVAYFSSTTHKNAIVILDKLLTKEQREKTVFFWFRDKTHLDPDFEKDPNIKDYDTIKLLSDVYDNPLFNRTYNSKNTVLCDDSHTKNRFNNPSNLIIVTPYDGSNKDNTLDELIKVIESKFINLTYRPTS